MLSFFALKNYPRYRGQAALTEAIVIASTFAQELTADFLERGVWKKPGLMLWEEDWIIEQVELGAAGAIHVTFSAQESMLAGKTLSFRPSENAEVGTVIWLCGYARPIENFLLKSENRTNISEVVLPRACR